MRDFPFTLPPGKGGNNADHLIVSQAGFKLELIVTDTGVGIVCFDDTVQNILTVFALIQGKVVFFQLVR